MKIKTTVNRANLKKILPRIRKRTTPGASPGTIQVSKDAQQTQIKVFQFNNEIFEETLISTPAQLSQLNFHNKVTWVQIQGLGDASLINAIGSHFKLHRLALEDVVNGYQRVKMEDYGEYMYCVLRYITRNDTLLSEQFNIFWGKNFVLTFSEHSIDVLNRVLERLRNCIGRIRGAGADYLTYCVIDAIIDGYFPVVDFYADQIECLDQIVTEYFAPRVISALPQS